MKRAMGASVLALAVILFSGTAYAKDMAGRFGLGANWFYYLPSEADFDGDTFDNEGTPEAFNISASYCLPQVTDTLNVAVGIDWEYISRDITDEDPGDFSDDLGTVTMMPLMVNAQVRFASLGRVTPYLGFGLGVSFNSIAKGDQADEIEEAFESKYGANLDIDNEVDHSFAFKVPVGMDIFITDNIALNVEAKYFYTKPDVEQTIESGGWFSDTTSDEVDQSTFAFGAGASFLLLTRIIRELYTRSHRAGPGTI
jgi:opacity protein-like surface antigen